MNRYYCFSKTVHIFLTLSKLFLDGNPRQRCAHAPSRTWSAISRERCTPRQPRCRQPIQFRLTNTIYWSTFSRGVSLLCTWYLRLRRGLWGCTCAPFMAQTDDDDLPLFYKSTLHEDKFWIRKWNWVLTFLPYWFCCAFYAIRR